MLEDIAKPKTQSVSHFVRMKNENLSVGDLGTTCDIPYVPVLYLVPPKIDIKMQVSLQLHYFH
jgi:hypothetical protein